MKVNVRGVRWPEITKADCQDAALACCGGLPVPPKCRLIGKSVMKYIADVGDDRNMRLEPGLEQEQHGGEPAFIGAVAPMNPAAAAPEGDNPQNPFAGPAFHKSFPIFWLVATEWTNRGYQLADRVGALVAHFGILHASGEAAREKLPKLKF